MQSIVIELPLPPVVVRPNGRSHWRVKANAVKTLRLAAWLEVLAKYGQRQPWSAASVLIEWHHPTKRMLDRDNIIASCKSYIDGIADADVIEDDVCLTYEPVVRCVCKRGDLPRVTITLTPIAGNEHQATLDSVDPYLTAN